MYINRTDNTHITTANKTPITLSVVVCTYNRLSLLKETLWSITSQQTTFPMEIIVADDFSTDGTREYLEALQFQNTPPHLTRKDIGHYDIRILLQPANYGPGLNWAYAMKEVRGKYVAFLDDDDIYTATDRMQIMVNYLETHPEADAVYTNAVAVNVNNGHKSTMDYPTVDFPSLKSMSLGKQPNISLCLMMVRCSTLERCIDFDDYIKYKFPVQDWPTNILLLNGNATFHFIDMPTVEVRLTEKSESRNLGYEEYIEKIESSAVMDSYISRAISGDDTITHSVDKRKLYHGLITIAYRRGDWHKAKEYAMLTNEKSFRNTCTHRFITFHAFRILKSIRSHFLHS